MNNKFRNNRMYKKGYKDGKEISEDVLLEKINNLKSLFIDKKIEADELKERLENLVEKYDAMIEEKDNLLLAVNESKKLIVKQSSQIEKTLQINEQALLKINRQAEEINEQALEINRQAEEINEQALEIDRQAEEINEQTQQINDLTNELKNSQKETNSAIIEIDNLQENMKKAFDDLDEIKTYVDEKERLTDFKHESAIKINDIHNILDVLRMARVSEDSSSLSVGVSLYENMMKQCKNDIKSKEQRTKNYKNKAIDTIQNKSGLSYNLCEAIFDELYS